MAKRAEMHFLVNQYAEEHRALISKEEINGQY